MAGSALNERTAFHAPVSRRAIGHNIVILVEGFVHQAWLHTKAKEIYHLHSKCKLWHSVRAISLSSSAINVSGLEALIQQARLACDLVV